MPFLRRHFRCRNNKSGSDGDSLATDADESLKLKSKKAIPEAKDAKEVAKKLVRSGAIAAFQKSVEKEAANRAEKSMGFKRSQGTAKIKLKFSIFPTTSKLFVFF